MLTKVCVMFKLLCRICSCAVSSSGVCVLLSKNNGLFDSTCSMETVYQFRGNYVHNTLRNMT